MEFLKFPFFFVVNKAEADGYGSIFVGERGDIPT